MKFFKYDIYQWIAKKIFFMHLHFLTFIFPFAFIFFGIYNQFCNFPQFPAPKIQIEKKNSLSSSVRQTAQPFSTPKNAQNGPFLKKKYNSRGPNIKCGGITFGGG